MCQDPARGEWGERGDLIGESHGAVGGGLRASGQLLGAGCGQLRTIVEFARASFEVSEATVEGATALAKSLSTLAERLGARGKRLKPGIEQANALPNGS